MPALRVHDPRRGEAASLFDGQVSSLALHSSALHRYLDAHSHTLSEPGLCSSAGLNTAVVSLPQSRPGFHSFCLSKANSC